MEYQYDALNRATKVTYPDGTNGQVARDAIGRIVGKTDQALLTTQYSYDPAGRLLQTTDALGQITLQAYDELGEQISQTDANGHVTTYAYDKMGRRTRRTLPLGMAETWTYDAAGNVSSHTDFRGKTTTYAYDLINRPLTKVPDPTLGEPTVSFTYTVAGERTSMVDAAGTTQYTYDQRSRLLTKAAPQGTLTYSWDAAGNLLSIRSSNANGTSVTYAYDALNRLSTVTDNRLAAGLTQYSYDAVGNLAGVLYPNGVESRYGYDSQNRLSGLAAVKGTTAVGYFAYSLGSAGNRLSLTEASGRQVSYSYDALYRLTGEMIVSDPNGANGTVAYTLDAVGNRLTRTSSLAVVPSTTNTYDANDRLTSDGYDANGSTTASGANGYVYDYENRLKQMNPGGVAIVYDGDGNRVAMTAGGVTTTYLVDTANPTGYPQVLEELIGAAAQRVYTYGVARISQSQLLNAAWNTTFYGYDGQGSVRYLTDVTGTVTDQYTYDGFGIQLAGSGTTPNVYRYAGEPFDQPLQLVYMRARYMNPRSGRFWTMDTFGGNNSDPPSLHKYLYAGSDPINKTDPSGQIMIPLVIAGVAGIMLLSFLFIQLTLDQAKAMYEGQRAQQRAVPMIQAALGNLQSGRPVLQMRLFLEEFIGVDYYLGHPWPDISARQLALVTANYQRLRAGVQHPIFYFDWHLFWEIDTRAASVPDYYDIALAPSFFSESDEEQSRIIVHELCHIVLGMNDLGGYGNATIDRGPRDLGTSPEIYSYYALESWQGQGP
jgi:RHS repeat-associated protein